MGDFITKQCSISGCSTRGKIRRGMCATHYSRWYRTGDPLTDGRVVSRDIAFSNFTEWVEGCLVWVGSKLESGYGQIRVGEKMMLAHRFSWEKEHGSIPAGMVIDHICHNPSCVNIDHLRLASVSQNNSYRSGATESNKSSGVRNVYKARDKWRVVIQKNGKAYRFGVYDTVQEAADVAARERGIMFGEFAGRA